MLQILGQSSDGGGAAAGVGIFVFLIYFAVIIVTIAGWWKAFEKAGQPGWAAIIPIYNIYILLKIVGREPWWLILFLIPCVNIVAAVIVYMDVAKSYGKEPVWGLGLLFLSPIFWPMLGFGSAQYRGPAAAQGTVGM